MNRDGASPKRAASVRAAAGSVTSAPMVPRIADSVTATAAPPSLQSWAEDSQPRATGIGDPRHSLAEGPKDLRMLRIAEVQTVGESKRRCPHTGEVGGSLGHRPPRPAIGIEIREPAVSIGDQRQAARRKFG